jgi:hypothetical protein
LPNKQVAVFESLNKEYWRVYQAMTKRNLLTQIPILPKDISIFLPSLLSTLTSITL